MLGEMPRVPHPEGLGESPAERTRVKMSTSWPSHVFVYAVTDILKYIQRERQTLRSRLVDLFPHDTIQVIEFSVIA